jgi:hypothetical protein
MFDLNLYNDEFFLWHLTYAREYSIKTMDWYIDTFKPNSVVDFEQTEYVKQNWIQLNVGCPNYIINNLIIFKHRN